MARTLEEAEALITKYENNGPAKLYYSLNRKSWEMADLLNGISLKSLDIGDAKDKTFERLKSIWSDAHDIALAIKALGEIAGITDNEARDVARKPFTDLIAQTRY